MSNDRKLPPVECWEPTNLQLIVFPVEPLVALKKTWWEQLTGKEQFESTRKKLEFTETGQFEDLILTVATDVTKISWSIMPQVDTEEIAAGLPRLGPFPESLARFKTLMNRWLSAFCPPVNRIGFAGTLLQNTETKQSGYQMLGGYLPSVRIDPKSFDFSYRINRKTPSAIANPELLINRINSWSILKMQGFFKLHQWEGYNPYKQLMRLLRVC